MSGSDLFLNLVLRLRHYPDAAVLWVLIKELADIKELKITTMLLSHVQLAGTIDRVAAHRAIKSLQASGLISVRVHRKTATLVTVNRANVLALLREPLDERLPGLSAKAFPFLDAWADDKGPLAVEPEDSTTSPSNGSEVDISASTGSGPHETGA